MSVAKSTQERIRTTRRVQDFYELLPFNMHGSIEQAASSVRATRLQEVYPDLAAALLRAGPARDRGRRPLDVLEIGCGGGWLTMAIASTFHARVHAIDLAAASVERAHELAKTLGVADRVEIERADVFDFKPPRTFDLAVSIGALHHTTSPAEALRSMVEAVQPGGLVHVGLYHGPGRQIFLDEMARVIEASGEDAAFELYCSLDGARAGDPVLQRSWFRDQVLHPHESQHTLREVAQWFADLNFDLVSTSINQFAPFESLEPLFELELQTSEVARRALFVEKRFFPGFFTAMGRRRLG